MNIKNLTFDEMIKKFDDFEQKFREDPTNKMLLGFFTNYSNIITNSGYTEEQIEQIRNRVLQLKALLSEAREELSLKSDMLLKRYNAVSKYIRTSNIKNTSKWN
jgi:hypothetical protein